MGKINQKELKQIFIGIKNNNSYSFEEFCKLYYKLIYNIAFSIIKSKENSDDVTHNFLFSKIKNYIENESKEIKNLTLEQETKILDKLIEY